MNEPTVLDYVKSKIFFWRREIIHIPPADTESTLMGEMVPSPLPGVEILPAEPGEPPSRLAIFPPGSVRTLVRLLLTLVLTLFAQCALEPPNRSLTTGVIFYLLAAAWLTWSNSRGEWKLALPPTPDQKSAPLAFRRLGLWICIPLASMAFLMFGNNRFTTANLTVWVLAFGAFLYTFWLPNHDELAWWEKLQGAWQRFREKGITFSPWTLLVLAVFALAAFYRFYQLGQVPAEMFSDHAEKLLDVADVLDGQTSIFFPRNTGREAFQMYLTAAMALIFNTGLSFLSLKLGTALCGLFTLPFIYLLGKEVANRRVGLLAMFFAGIAYWPNVISRVALRFTLYPFFAAPALYFLIRGLQRRNRNDFILSGIALGLGLHGYSPYRFMPIVVVVAVGLYLLHQGSQGATNGTKYHAALNSACWLSSPASVECDQRERIETTPGVHLHLTQAQVSKPSKPGRCGTARKEAVWGLAMVAFTSLMIFLPLLRYAISEPAMFSYRMMTRMTSVEAPLPGPALEIFFKNLWNAVTMFFWDDGEIWVHSIPHRPALGVVSATFFFLGVVLLLVRYIRERHWLDIFLLVSIPLLMMPSALSLAFPAENPSLNRTGGALIPVFLIVGMAFDSLLTTLKSRPLAPGGTWLALGVAAILLVWSAAQNYDLVFEQYNQQFRRSAWNTSELGDVIRQFADSAGAEDSAWVVPYPYWVDTRLVGIRAGFPARDYALWPDDIIDTVDDPRAKLFLFKPEDTETLGILRELYPTGVLRLYESQVEDRDFYMYSVPPIE